jgi:hypothetical protein
MVAVFVLFLPPLSSLGMLALDIVIITSYIAFGA